MHYITIPALEIGTASSGNRGHALALITFKRCRSISFRPDMDAAGTMSVK